jgi:hypothetical protein
MRPRTPRATGEAPVEEGVGCAGVDVDLVGDLGGLETPVELVHLVLGDALVGAAEQAEQRSADLAGAFERPGDAESACS